MHGQLYVVREHLCLLEFHHSPEIGCKSSPSFPSRQHIRVGQVDNDFFLRQHCLLAPYDHTPVVHIRPSLAEALLSLYGSPQYLFICKVVTHENDGLALLGDGATCLFSHSLLLTHLSPFPCFLLVFLHISKCSRLQSFSCMSNSFLM